MIAHVVFDLPLEGPFDYLIPPELEPQIKFGVRVKAPFGPKTLTGFVVSTAAKTDIHKIKSVKKTVDACPVFDQRDLAFARQFCAYYGCSLGEALGLMLRHRQGAAVESPAPDGGRTFLYHCPDGKYTPVIESLTKDRADYAILVPDAYVLESLSLLQSQLSRAGLRSSMFAAFAACRLLIVVDDDNGSYKQEQSPMYDTRDVVFMAQAVYGFDVAFVGTSPTPELMHLADTKKIGYERGHAAESRTSVIDVSQYKFLDKGLLSPPVRNALQEDIGAGRRALIIVNRRGTYNVTRCTGCGHVLLCGRCDSPLVYVRAQKGFVCRHCTYHLPGTPDCPQCGKPEWKSFGVGVEQVQKTLSGLFPTARFAVFEKDMSQLPAVFDVLIATQAVLRFKATLDVETVAFLDFDREINRMDMRSSFRGWAMAAHMRILGRRLLVQTRNPQHHVLKALAADDVDMFCKEELRLRKDLDFAPFYHWVAIMLRSKAEKSAQSAAEAVYNELSQNKPAAVAVGMVQADIPAKIRDQYRFRVMVGGVEVTKLTGFIKQTLAKMKRASKVITTLNVDP